MIADANKDTNFEKSDICIMGAGVAGITLALKLIKSGKKVFLLESGYENYDPEIQKLYESESKPDIFPSTTFSRLRLLGGSSNHWENSTERFDPIDFEKRDWVKDSGWPISYSDIESYYPEAESLCSLDDKGYSLSFWEKELNFSSHLKDSKVTETSIIKSGIPLTRFYYKYGKKLVDAENITVITNANVVGINYRDGNVTSVKIKNFEAKEQIIDSKVFIMSMGGIENARLLLHFNQQYNNQIGNHYDNVGRYFMEHPTIRAANLYPINGNLGKIYNGVFHNNQMITARFKLTEETQKLHKVNNLRLILNNSTNLDLSSGISSANVISEGLKNSDLPDNFGRHLMNVLKDIDLIGEQLLRKKLDTSFFESANEFAGYQLISMIEQTPDRDNRITLGTEKDKLGIAKIKINWKVTDSDKKQSWESLSLLAKDPVINKIGRMKLLHDQDERIWNSQLGFGQHHMGTTRMGSDEKTSVVDENCKVFGTSNLYIAGSSVFPTGGHVPPTLTIVAMSLKLAEKIQQVV